MMSNELRVCEVKNNCPATSSSFSRTLACVEGYRTSHAFREAMTRDLEGRLALLSVSQASLSLMEFSQNSMKTFEKSKLLAAQKSPCLTVYSLWVLTRPRIILGAKQFACQNTSDLEYCGHTSETRKPYLNKSVKQSRQPHWVQEMFLSRRKLPKTCLFLQGCEHII